MKVACGASHDLRSCGHGGCRDLDRLRCGCCVDLQRKRQPPYTITNYRNLTLRKEPCLAILYVLSKIPAISKIVVSFYKPDSVPFAEAQFIGTSSFKVIWITDY